VHGARWFVRCEISNSFIRKKKRNKEEKKMTNVFHMDPNEFERISEILRVLAHPVRLRIVHQLIKKKSLNVSELQQFLSMPQSTVSQHLSKLKTHKVVAYERKGLEVFYRVDDEKVKQTLKILTC
jgi:DNA-binding transcriptional ArsR family regulator